MVDKKKPSVKKTKCRKCGKMNAVPPAVTCPTCKRVSKVAAREKARNTRAQKVYGLADGDYMTLWKNSPHGPGTCYICGSKASGRPHIDHDHKLEGRESVRGLLCYMCNSILLARVAKDDPDKLEFILRNAIEYLRNPPARKILGG